MPRPRYAQLPEPKRRQILDAAAQEFARHGFNGASYNRIIRIAGVSKGAMYYYFDDKEDLFLTTALDVFTRAKERFGAYDDLLPPYADAEDFWRRMQTANLRLWALLAEDPLLIGIGKALVQDSHAESSRAYLELLESTRAVTNTLIEAGQAIGAVRSDLEPALLASALLGMGEGLDRYVLARWDQLDPSYAETLPATVFDLFIRVAAPIEVLPRLLRLPAASPP